MGLVIQGSVKKGRCWGSSNSHIGPGGLGMAERACLTAGAQLDDDPKGLHIDDTLGARKSTRAVGGDAETVTI